MDLLFIACFSENLPMLEGSCGCSLSTMNELSYHFRQFERMD